MRRIPRVGHSTAQYAPASLMASSSSVNTFKGVEAAENALAAATGATRGSRAATREAVAARAMASVGSAEVELERTTAQYALQFV